MRKQKTLVKKYNILKNEIVILSVANISPLKGIDVLLESFIVIIKVSFDSIIHYRTKKESIWEKDRKDGAR